MAQDWCVGSRCSTAALPSSRASLVGLVGVGGRAVGLWFGSKWLGCLLPLLWMFVYLLCAIDTSSPPVRAAFLPAIISPSRPFVSNVESEHKLSSVGHLLSSHTQLSEVEACELCCTSKHTLERSQQQLSALHSSPPLPVLPSTSMISSCCQGSQAATPPRPRPASTPACKQQLMGIESAWLWCLLCVTADYLLEVRRARRCEEMSGRLNQHQRRPSWQQHTPGTLQPAHQKGPVGTPSLQQRCCTCAHIVFCRQSWLAWAEGRPVRQG